MSFNRINFQREADATPPAAPAEPQFTPYSQGGEEYVTEEQEEPAEGEPTPADPAAPAPAEPAPAEPAEPIKEPAAVLPPVPEDIKPVDWKAALKTADKWEALKELGYDDFTIGLLKYKEQTGDLTPYVQAKTVDYTKMSAAELLKMDLRNKNKGLSEKALNFKFNKEFSDKYFLDRDNYPDGSDEAEIGEELLKQDAEELRKKFIEDQQNFKAPEPKPDQEAATRAAAVKARQEVQKTIVTNSPATRSFQAAKAVTFGEGEESFTYPVTNAQALVDSALQTLQASEETNISDESISNFLKLLAVSADINGFQKALADHYRKLGKRDVQKEVQSVTPKSTTATPEVENLTPAQQLARHGTIK